MTDHSSLPPRQASEQLLNEYVTTQALRHHCRMVAQAMEAYAHKLEEDPELWYQAGLLHDLDWEKYPDEHPFKAVHEILKDYPETLKQAILAHGPHITGKQPETTLERYLFACDELSGLMHAVSLMRPNGFADMQVKSVKKKLKDKGFAANVSREDITQGVNLIGKSLEEHIAFLIEVYKKYGS
jgi:putative nucleotidyltransferase with HDIG domain